jgi:hypothetical protein
VTDSNKVYWLFGRFQLQPKLLPRIGRVQFGNPGTTASTAAGNTFGIVLLGAGSFHLRQRSRTGPVLRGPGANNWNASIYKKTAITERFNLETAVVSRSRG